MKSKRKPPLTPSRVERERAQLQALYGTKALPKELPAPVPPKAPAK
jgi:hypothetical protein